MSLNKGEEVLCLAINPQHPLNVYGIFLSVSDSALEDYFSNKDGNDGKLNNYT